MKKVSWIILGSALGVTVCASVLTPILLIPNIYKVNDIKSFVQKYTPVRSMEAYESIQENSQPSSKLIFFSFIYTLVVTQVQFENIKTNGLHNSLSFTIKDGQTEHIKLSYSDSEVTKRTYVFQTHDYTEFVETEYWVFSCNNNIPIVSGPLDEEYDEEWCPIWNGKNINWDPFLV